MRYHVLNTDFHNNGNLDNNVLIFDKNTVLIILIESNTHHDAVQKMDFKKHMSTHVYC